MRWGEPPVKGGHSVAALRLGGGSGSGLKGAEKRGGKRGRRGREFFRRTSGFEWVAAMDVDWLAKGFLWGRNIFGSSHLLD